MAVVYPIVKSESYDGGCYGNFLSKRVGHYVRPIGQELVFEDIRDSVPSKSLRTRIVSRGSLYEILRIPGAVFGDNSLDALLVHSRSVEGGRDVQDTLGVHVFDPEEHSMKLLKSKTFTMPDYNSRSRVPSVIAVCDIQGINYGTVLFFNGTVNRIFKWNPTGNLETISLSMRGQPGNPAGLFWVTPELAAVVHDMRFTNIIEFVEFGTKKKDFLKQTVPAKVQFVGAGPTRGTVIVLFSSFFTIYKLTKRDVQVVKEFALDLPQGSRAWSPLEISRSGDTFYMSSNQDVLLVREKRPPTLLKVHEGVPGRLAPLGFGVFAIVTNSNALRFCQFRLNRAGTNICAELRGSRELPSGGLGLRAHTKSSTFGQRFWWKESVSGNMLVTQASFDVRRDVCFSDFNGNVSGISATTTAADEPCYILSTEGKSVLASVENREVKAIDTVSWQVLDEETVFANGEVQVTRTQVVWRNGTVVSFDDRINVVSCEGPLLALATNECAFIYFKGEEVSTINMENTIISISCNARGVVAILTFDKLVVYDHSTKSTKERTFDVFCTAVIVADSGAVHVGTGRGELLGDADLKVSLFPIRKIFTYGSDLIVTDTSASAYHVNEQGKVTRLSMGITNALLPLADNNYLTVCGGMVQVVGFSPSAARCYESYTVPAFPSAPDSISYSNGSFYAFYWAEREVHVTTPQDFLNSAVHRFADVEDTGEEACNQFFLLDSSLILEVVHRNLDNSESDFDSEDDDDAGVAFFEVRIIVRLHKLDPEVTQCILLHEQEVTVAGDPLEEPVVRFVKSSHMFCVLCGTTGAIFGTIASEKITLRDLDSLTLDLCLFDHWMFDKTSEKVVCVTADGHVMSTSVVNWDHLLRASEYSSGCICDAEGQSVYEALPLSRKQVYAATLKQHPLEKFCKVVIFSFVDGIVTVLANFVVPGRKITLLKSDDFAPGRDVENFTPDFYIGTRDGALYAVSLVQDSDLAKSLGLVQLSLLQDMGFAEQSEDMKGSIDGSLLQAAAQHQEYKHLFEENGVSAESISTGLLNLIE